MIRDSYKVKLCCK